MYLRCLCLACVLAGTGATAAGISVSDGKQLPDGRSVLVLSKAVTYAATNFFYIEEPSGTCGIRVEQPNHGFSVGTLVNLNSTIRTSANGERYLTQC